MLMVQRSLVAFGRTRRYRPYGRDDKDRYRNSGFPFKHCTFILAPHRFAELTLDYKQGEQLFMFCIKQFGRADPAPTY